MKTPRPALRPCRPGQSPSGAVASLALAAPAMAQDETAQAVGGALGGFIAALIGAVVLILIVGLIRKAAK